LGAWEKINRELLREDRKKKGKTEDSSGAMIDRQVVRATEKRVFVEVMLRQKIKGRKGMLSLSL